MHVFGILTITLKYKHNERVARGFVRLLESNKLFELYQRKGEKKPSIIKNK